MAQTDAVHALQERLAFEQKLVQLVDRIHSAKSLDAIFTELHGEILALFDADRMTLYAVDHDKKELYSRYLQLDTVREIRLPITEKSITGSVATWRQIVNIADAYDKAELARISPNLGFDSSWDQKTGFRTTQVLAVPIVHEGKTTLGVLQLLNKKHGPRFTKEDETSAARIAKTLGIAFNNQAQLGQRRGGKFDYLLTQQLITQEELNAATGEARRRQVDLEAVLTEQYKIQRGDIGAALSQFYKVPFVEFSDKIIPPPDLMKELKLEFLKRNLWLPLRREDKAVTVLIDNPQDLQKVDSVNHLLSGYKIQLAVGLKKDILQYLGVAGGEQAGGSKESISNILGELQAEDAPGASDDASGYDVDENDSSIIRLTNQMIIDAYKARASDIHVEPYGPQKDVLVRFRIDGSCREYQKVPGTFRRAMAARLKIMAMLDIAERRKPQDGKIKFRMQDREIELRVATIPTAGGNEDVVMRILAASEPIPIDKLGMTERNLGEIKKIAEKPYGLILVVGPTGSGKTTTLHSVLGYINKPERKIWTAEDPVEITQYGLRQVQVQPKIGFTFAGAMRAFLRADPDVIMVGEMRDEETASTGIEASLTGHLVFSTLHTNSAVETVIRLLDMGLDPFNFADALLGVLAQRLVKRLCPECKEEYHPERDEYDELAAAWGKEDFEKLEITYDDDFSLYRGKGCGNCNNSGYRGRAGIHELLIATDEIKRLIQTKARVSEMLVRARVEGMTTLVQDGILKSLSGVTDFRQVKAVAIK
ncbi:MAG: GspE/PulE family protein [Candidatus Rokubacteria bacterium]|nr:GspE/PulE family protein [Candidatus Rokubacteria bacterium]